MRKNPYHFIRRILTLVMMLTISVQAAQGQSLSASSISIDISNGGATAEPLLIAAYQPPVDVAPRLSGQIGNRPSGAAVINASLPRPSIILGTIGAGQEDAFGIERLLPATVAQIGFDYTDLAAREALRQRDPVLFRKLIEQGHVDPPEETLKAALQTELSRMNCYRSRIDNAWGPGSRRSVKAYFKEAGGTDWPDQEPSMELFRAIVLKGDVTCAAPVAAARRDVRPSGTRVKKKRTATAAKKTRRAPAKPRASTNRPRINAGAGIGVFR